MIKLEPYEFTTIIITILLVRKLRDTQVQNLGYKPYQFNSKFSALKSLYQYDPIRRMQCYPNMQSLNGVICLKKKKGLVDKLNLIFLHQHIDVYLFHSYLFLKMMRLNC